MKIESRLKNLEQAVFKNDAIEIIVYGPKLDSDDYIIKRCNGQETMLTMAEFEAEEAASRKRGERWISVGGGSDED